MQNVAEVKCGSILNPSKIPGMDYCINPYTGCSHGCRYCYADFMAKYAYRQPEDWGKFLHVKINAAEVLLRQITKMKRGTVYMSSVTDPYLPEEREYKLTRDILRILLRYNFPVVIQTKSSMVLRDLDLLKKFSSAEVGFTITLDDELAKKFEPGASPSTERINALKKIRETGIKTYVFIGPVLPYLSEPLDIIRQTQRFADYYLIDRLNLKGNTWSKIRKFLAGFDRNLIPKYREILYRKSSYYRDLKQEILTYCKKQKIECRFCY